MNLILEKVLTRKNLHCCRSDWFLLALGFITIALFSSNVFLAILLCQPEPVQLVLLIIVSIVIHLVINLTLVTVVLDDPFRKEKSALIIFTISAINFLISGLLTIWYCQLAAVFFVGLGNIPMLLLLYGILRCCYRSASEPSIDLDVHAAYLDSVSLSSYEPPGSKELAL